MAGVIFDNFNGYLQVDFFNGPWLGDIEIVFRINGDATVTTPCDDDFVKGKPEVFVAKDAQLRCWTSSSICYFFRGMVSWLEAVTCNVDECAFFWDGEGPEGELRWFRGVDGSGLLKMAWTGRHDSAAFAQDVRLERDQMVRALYQSFRSFVESDRYDPISYERLLLGEVFDLVLIEGRQALALEIAARDRPGAYALIQTISEFAHESKNGPRRRSSLAEFMRMSEAYWRCGSSDDELVVDAMSDLLGEMWNDWPTEERLRYVEEAIYAARGYGGDGEKLRELRSHLVESWLTDQATLKKSGGR